MGKGLFPKKVEVRPGFGKLTFSPIPNPIDKKKYIEKRIRER